MARRGARSLGDPEVAPGSASAAWQRAISRSRGTEEDGIHGTEAEPWEPEVWFEDDEDFASDGDHAGDGRDDSRGGDRGRTSRLADRGAGSASGSRRTGAMEPAAEGGRPRPRRRLPPAVRDELSTAVGPSQATRFTDRLADATRAYERDRYQDAHRILRSLADFAPQASAVRELLGLTLYRMGKWAAAAKELELFVELSGSTDQHPTLADSYRALKRHKRVAELWNDLRQASPSAEVVTEGRIVMAESLADQDDVAGAIKLLEKGGVDRKRPKEHHLRQWYALADLYERAGDIPRARQLFRRIAEHGPETFEVEDRLRALR